MNDGIPNGAADESASSQTVPLKVVVAAVTVTVTLAMLHKEVAPDEQSVI